jgi:hypothetical protein
MHTHEQGSARRTGRPCSPHPAPAPRPEPCPRAAPPAARQCTLPESSSTTRALSGAAGRRAPGSGTRVLLQAGVARRHTRGPGATQPVARAVARALTCSCACRRRRHRVEASRAAQLVSRCSQGATPQERRPAPRSGGSQQRRRGSGPQGSRRAARYQPGWLGRQLGRKAGAGPTPGPGQETGSACATPLGAPGARPAPAGTARRCRGAAAWSAGSSRGWETGGLPQDRRCRRAGVHWLGLPWSQPGTGRRLERRVKSTWRQAGRRARQEEAALERGRRPAGRRYAGAAE